MKSSNKMVKITPPVMGLLFGCIASIFGSLLYSFEKHLELILRNNTFEYPIWWSFAIIFFFAFIVSLLPTMIGGYLLGFLVEKDLKKGKLLRNKTSKQGIIIGCTFGLCLGVIALFGSGPHVPMGLILFESLKGLLLAGFVGWFIARQLGKWVEKKFVNIVDSDEYKD